jgi:hypothetical protein
MAKQETKILKVFSFRFVEEQYYIANENEKASPSFQKSIHHHFLKRKNFITRG